MANLTIETEIETTLRALLGDPTVPQIHAAATDLLTGLESEFSNLEFHNSSGSKLEAPDWVKPFVVETKTHSTYETPRDGTSYKSSMTLRGRWIVSVPGESYGTRAFQLPDGTLLWHKWCPGDAYYVGSGWFANLRWGVPGEDGQMPKVITVDDLAREILRAAEAIREWRAIGLVEIPDKSYGSPLGLPKEYTKANLFGVRFVQGPLTWVKEGFSPEAHDRRGGVLRTPDGEWWQVNHHGEVSRMDTAEKRRLRRQEKTGGTVRDFVERTRSYPARATLNGFPNLFVEEGCNIPDCTCKRGPFRVVTSYTRNGYGVIRRMMAKQEIRVEAPILPDPGPTQEDSLSRFCAEHRLVPVLRTLTGSSLMPPHLVVLFREDGGTEVLRSFVTGPWAFLRKLQAEAKRVGRNLTESELRELASEPAPPRAE